MNRLLHVLIPIVFIVIISGCSNNEDKTHVLFISSIPHTLAEEVEDVVSSAVQMHEDLRVQMHPMSYERLMVEIAVHNGEILFLDEQLMSAAYDPTGLVPLDEILNDEWESLIPDDYRAVDEKTGQTHVYAIPFNNDSSFLENLGVELENPLVAIVPIYAENKAFSMELLQYIMETN
ncbi:hypothetical protein [Halalkalibacter akibai]|uniref:hypothetical protein n=1 Tax=Halalkalibacter akibai TaxID=1411 RepID=UPI0005510F64|nr:hypothetical protein [Halalkalibacter akibai]